MLSKVSNVVSKAYKNTIHQFICITIAAIAIATPAIVFLCVHLDSAKRHIARVAIARLAIGGDSDADELVVRDIYLYIYKVASIFGFSKITPPRPLVLGG